MTNKATWYDALQNTLSPRNTKDENPNHDPKSGGFASSGGGKAYAGATPSGYPTGGYHAIDPEGNIIKKPDAKYGDLAPRFKDEEHAISWGTKQLGRKR